MAEPLVVSLLGPPRVSQAGVPVPCASRKALGLFAYLMLSTRPHPRRELAALMWGRRDDDAARASLRVALHRLPAVMAACLRVERESIERVADAAPRIDVANFEALAQADDLASLRQAAELYQGDLLQDFEADATPEFDDWLHAQRNRLSQLAQRVFDIVIASHADRARHDAAGATAERESALALGLRWTQLMPGAEAAHRWLMRLYLDLGRRDAALAQFALCQRFLAVTYGRAPSAETRDLRDAALGGEPAKPAAAPDAVPETPLRDPVARGLVPSTSFVGRVEELAELEALFADPVCRLVTLHGLGGAGKTRLAHAFANHFGARFAQGVTWVALDAVDTGDALPAAIATALGRELPPRGNRADLVAAMLVGQQRLLVLDNLESVLGRATDADDADDADPATVIGRILDAAPHVRIVVTSREVLALQEEWVYDVHGLAATARPDATDMAPAVELFAQRARQAYLGFSLSAEMPHVQRIVALVEGLPLGIELAAAWVRTIPCGEIAAAIEREAAMLASPHRNRAERHRTLDAVVAYSWNLLRPDEQRALAALSAFAGGFARDAAERIADAPTRTLSALVDKSLVRRRADGRYDLHELVRQFAWARLAKARSRSAETVRRHAEFFASLLLDLYGSTRGPDEAVAHRQLSIELPNIMAAWTRSLDDGVRDVVERMAATLIAVLHYHARLPAALAAGERAVVVLGPRARADVLGAVRLQWGRAAVTGGVPDVAKRELEAALELVRHVGAPDAIARCLYYLGALALQQANFEAVDALMSDALPLADRSEDQEVVALVHNLIGSLANLRSHFDVAESHLRQGLAAARNRGTPSLVGGMLCSLAVPLYYRGNYAEAADLSAEAARVYEDLGRNATVINLRGNVAGIKLAQGDLAGAYEQVVMAVALARDAGDQNELCNSLATLADIRLQQESLADARAAADESLRIATAINKPLQITEALYLLVTLDLREAHYERVLPMLVRLRASLAEHALTVRVPMLVLGAADFVATVGDASQWPRARNWIGALCQLTDIDASLREKGQRMLARESATRGDPGPDTSSPMTLDEIEADVGAFLDGK